MARLEGSGLTSNFTSPCATAVVAVAGPASPPSTGASAAANCSGVKGLAMRNRAPAAVAFSRISSEPSEVTKPNGTSIPEPRRFCSISYPLASGMFQSERTMSGFSLRTASNPSLPFSAWTTSTQSNPACRSVRMTICRMTRLSSTTRAFT